VTATASRQRSSGVLLHITTLPSAFGIGDMGPEAYRFADLLAQNKQHWWSILPLTPTRLEDGNSPYQTSSAFAGNPLLISPQKLAENGLLPKEYADKPIDQTSKVHYKEVYRRKEALIERAFATFRQLGNAEQSSFEGFCSENEKWLNNYAVYSALRRKIGKPWHLWPTAVRKREPTVLANKERASREEIEAEKFAQYCFFSQWRDLKDYCKTQRIRILGDMPFYVAHDSSDVWVHPELFSLYANGKPHFVGGVPPDYFSTDGQLWGNPVYDWQKLEETGFEWWLDRIRHNLTLFDELRLDHFRGFIAYWRVSAHAKTAKRGNWIEAPSDRFFRVLKKAFPSLPFIAEDLGYIDEPVKQAIKRWRLPGMKVLLFAFDGDKNNPHLPKNHPQNAVVYTGTHDTNTVRGWFNNEATAKEKVHLYQLLGRSVSGEEVSFELIKLALASKARLSIIPLQDVLSLGADIRRVVAGDWQTPRPRRRARGRCARRAGQRRRSARPRSRSAIAVATRSSPRRDRFENPAARCSSRSSCEE
jgi:4-alpha-glucanotransferase